MNTTSFFDMGIKQNVIRLAGGMNAVIVYAVTLGPLAACFLFYFVPYLKALDKRWNEHGKSGLQPLISLGYRAIRFNYTAFFITAVLLIAPLFIDLSTLRSLGVTSGTVAILIIVIAIGAFYLLFFFSFVSVYWFVTIYQLSISVFSIHRFFMRRKPQRVRIVGSAQGVNYMIGTVAFLVLLKDAGFGRWFLHINDIKYNDVMIDNFKFYFSIHYATYQILLFISMLLQFLMKTDPSTTHSEKVIAMHTKAFGGVKLLLFIIAGISVATNVQPRIATNIFFFIDIFLMPVVIELTEIMTDPNVAQVTEVRMEPVRIVIRAQ